MVRLSLGLAVCLLLTGCGTTLGPATPGDGMPAAVTAVVDGDTIEVRYANGSTETVRLIGVDTPEVRGENTPDEFEGVPDTPAGRTCLRRWGEQAAGYVRDLLTGRQVRVALDPAEGPRGSYGRLLAYVRLDGQTVNYRLVAEGYARVYDSQFSHRARYRTAEARARENASGVWHCAIDPAGSLAVADGGTGPVAIAAVHADPPGDDTENLTAEYVVLENVGNRIVDLTGWTVRDEAAHTYTFGSLTLGAGDRVTLHTGSGTDTGSHVYWGRSGAVWNNDGDVVTVADSNGTVVARYRY